MAISHVRAVEIVLIHRSVHMELQVPTVQSVTALTVCKGQPDRNRTGNDVRPRTMDSLTLRRLLMGSNLELPVHQQCATISQKREKLECERILYGIFKFTFFFFNEQT